MATPTCFTCQAPISENCTHFPCCSRECENDYYDRLEAERDDVQRGQLILQEPRYCGGETIREIEMDTDMGVMFETIAVLRNEYAFDCM